jgi:hypothetical protein
MILQCSGYSPDCTFYFKSSKVFLFDVNGSCEVKRKKPITPILQISHFASYIASLSQVSGA